MLEKPNDAKKTVFLMLPLSKRAPPRPPRPAPPPSRPPPEQPPGARLRRESPLLHGKQKLGCLLLQVKGDEPLEVSHPKTRAALAGVAPAVLAQALSDASSAPCEEPAEKLFRSAKGAAALSANVKARR